MIRMILKCVGCGGSDFDVYKSIVPSGVRLQCNECGCSTYLGLIDEFDIFHEINGDSMMSLYEESYSRDIKLHEIKQAFRNDKRKCLD